MENMSIMSLMEGASLWKNAGILKGEIHHVTKLGREAVSVGILVYRKTQLA